MESQSKESRNIKNFARLVRSYLPDRSKLSKLAPLTSCQRCGRMIQRSIILKHIYSCGFKVKTAKDFDVVRSARELSLQYRQCSFCSKKVLIEVFPQHVKSCFRIKLVERTERALEAIQSRRSSQRKLHSLSTERL